MMSDLSLESKVNRKSREVANLLGHVAIALLQLQWLSEIILQ